MTEPSKREPTSVDAEPVDEELRELERPRRDAVGIVGVLGDVRPDVRGAGPGRRHDGVEAGEHLDEPLRERRRDVRMTRVQVELPAAGLRARERDLDAEPLEKRDGGAPDGRLQRVRQAGDEERHAHRASLQHRSPI